MRGRRRCHVAPDTPWSMEVMRLLSLAQPEEMTVRTSGSILVVEFHEIRGDRSEVRFGSIGQHRETEGLLLLEIARATTPDRAAVQHDEVFGGVQLLLVSVAYEDRQGPRRRVRAKLSQSQLGQLGQRGGMDHHDVHVPHQSAQPPPECALLTRAWLGLSFGPCTSTVSSTVGSTCSLVTNADTVLPGTVLESKRSLWALDKVQIFDGDADTIGGNTLFATQGVFAS
jgi:hypothetical protein